MPILRSGMNAARTHQPVDSVEALTEAIARLVDERQRLRTSGADEAALERNRRAIAELQQRLSRALIVRFLPSAA
jgi:hypothetical protein